MSGTVPKGSRRFRLVDYLRDRHEPVPVSELANCLGVTVRTVLRDVDSLRAEGVPISGTRGRGGGLRLDAREDGSRDEGPPAIDAPIAVPGPMPRGTSRPIFVGRGDELATLRQVFKEVQAGRGRATMLAGEPGIGKTGLATAAVDEFAAQGALVLWGRCLESEGALPYWPWVQIIRALAATVPREKFVRLLGRGAADVGEIVPEIFGLIPDLERPASVTLPESERFRLFGSIGEFFRAISIDQPLVLVLEDLHRADRPTLLLFDFIAQQFAASAVMLIGTYRDVELNRRHPLTRTLVELNGQPGFLRITLRGLDEPEVREYVTLASGELPDQELVETLYRQTEGNPLFVTEMTLLLMGTSQGRHIGSESLRKRYRIPEGIREVIGQRLDRLSADSNRLLLTASVLGRDFSLSELKQLLLGASGDAEGGAPVESRLLAMIDEAERGHLLESLASDTNRYQFTHSLVRDTLYQELSALERVRLHQLAGEMLERLYGAENSPHLPQLAYHFLEAARGGHTRKAVRYAEMAGHHAAEMVAHEEAVRYFDMALQGLALEDQIDERRRCEVLLAKGKSQEGSGERLEARTTYRAVVDTAIPIGSIDLCVDAAVAFETAGWHPGLNGLPAVRLLRRVIDVLPGGDSAERARCLASLGRALNYSGLHETAMEVGNAAIEMARRVGDRRTLATAIWSRLATRSDPNEIYTRIELGNEAVRICEEFGDLDMMANSLAWILNDLMELGDPRWNEDFYRSWRTRVLKLRDPMWLYNLSTLEAGIACGEGQFEEAERMAGASLELGRRLGGLDAVGVHGSMMFCIRREQGRLHEVKPALELFLKHRPAQIWRPGLALLYSELDMRQGAATEFESLAQDEFKAVSRDSLYNCALAYLTDVCAYLGAADHAPFLHGELSAYEGRNISKGVANMYIGPAGRFIGRLEVLMARWEDAERHFEHAIQMAHQMRAPTQVAHCTHLLGEMLLQRNGVGDQQRGRALLEQALAQAREFGMRTLVLRVNRALMMPPSPLGTVTYYPDGLSAREAEVLALLARGRANREIGAELFITPNTVSNHVKSILHKTRAANRTEAAAYAVQHGFLKK